MTKKKTSYHTTIFSTCRCRLSCRIRKTQNTEHRTHNTEHTANNTEHRHRAFGPFSRSEKSKNFKDALRFVQESSEKSKN